MPRLKLLALPVALVLGLSGCTTTRRSMSPGSLEAMPQAETAAPGRMLIWRAWLTMEVDNVRSAVASIQVVAKQAGGYVENQSDSGAERATLTLRVPIGVLKPTLASLAAFGKVTRRSVSSEDVTETYVDIDARLKTMVALRDRLRTLLDKAQQVTEILAIEKELSRVQADIDSMQARLKSLQGKVDLASIDVSLKRKTILGPLGHLLRGVWWAVGKLFVIQE